MNCFKTSKNADAFLFLLLSFTKCQRKKSIERTFFASEALKKGEKQRVLGLLYHNIYRI